MRNGKRLGFVGVVATGIVSHLLGSPAEGAKESEELRTVQAAFDASAAALVSGIGEGVYRESERPDGGSAWEVKTDAKIKVRFDRGKYHIEFEYSQERFKTERQVIIHDGTAVFSTRFKKGIQPVGGQTEVFDCAEADGLVRPQAAGFPWDVTRLSASLVSVSGFLKHRPAEEIEVARSPAGDYVGRYGIGKQTLVTFECPARYAYNGANKRVFGSDRQKPTSEVSATWKKDGEVWYIDSLSEEWVLRDPESVSERRWELRYDKFQANAPVSPDLFSMQALGMPGGSRILDHRPKAPQRVHYVPHEDKALEKKLGTMVEQLSSLPVEPPRIPRAPPVPPSPYRRVLFWSMNAAIVLAILGLSVALWRLRRKGNR